MTFWQRIAVAWAAVGAAATAGFATWCLVAYRAAPEARAAMVSDSAVIVKREDRLIEFAPSGGRTVSVKRLLFVPGALVDPVAYAPLARAIADHGYRTTILELPARGAFGTSEAELLSRVRAIMDRNGGSTPWIIAGHSKGAVIASYIASQNVGNLAGVVLIGSSHPRDVSLASLSIPITKIVGTRDGLASPDKVRANIAKLPASTRWVSIEGGNHSQFGWYGFQPGDRFAKIPASEQRAIMIQTVLDALQQNSG